MTLTSQILAHLRSILVLPQRFRMRLPEAMVTVPMIRGVWGAALHAQAPELYRLVFDPEEHGPGQAPPLYLLRPITLGGAGMSALDFILYGEAVSHVEVLMEAWHTACSMGLDKERLPFEILDATTFGPTGQIDSPASPGQAWTLDAAWKAVQSAGLGEEPCRLNFVTPVRLIYRGRLIETPSLVDVVVAAHRRLSSLLPRNRRQAWDSLQEQLLDLARATPCGPWVGEQVEVERYSGSQQRPIVLKAVLGGMDLPAGPGLLGSLLAAASWTHVGKGTVFGLGGIAFEKLAAETETLRKDEDRSEVGKDQEESCSMDLLAPAQYEKDQTVPDVIFYSIGVNGPITPEEPLPQTPTIPRGALVVLEGRAPIWRYGMALHNLHGSPAGALAVYDPKLGAVVVATHIRAYSEGQVLDIEPPK